MKRMIQHAVRQDRVLLLLATLVITVVGSVAAQAADEKPTSYAPVALTEPFEDVVARMSAAKPAIMERQMQLLAERYDLADRPAAGLTMTSGKAVQAGVRVKLPAGITWQQLGDMTAEAVRNKGIWPKGFLPLPHPNHPEGGMVFPKYHIDEIKKQTDIDLTRFDLDYDLPDHFLPEYPPPMFLTTRPDLGDVSQGQVVTIDNYYGLFNGILNPKQLEGLRLLVTPFPHAAVQRD